MMVIIDEEEDYDDDDDQLRLFQVDLFYGDNAVAVGFDYTIRVVLVGP